MSTHSNTSDHPSYGSIALPGTNSTQSTNSNQISINPLSSLLVFPRAQYLSTGRDRRNALVPTETLEANQVIPFTQASSGDQRIRSFSNSELEREERRFRSEWQGHIRPVTWPGFTINTIPPPPRLPPPIRSESPLLLRPRSYHGESGTPYFNSQRRQELSLPVDQQYNLSSEEGDI